MSGTTYSVPSELIIRSLCFHQYAFLYTMQLHAESCWRQMPSKFKSGGSGRPRGYPALPSSVRRDAVAMQNAF
eukprot:6211365-Pleurochrysis_carterae.AAC.1